ncbi:choice-of-anchor Q domain-containing protein [Longitalea arenae]|uniref:choice-of-anchor Q domain-containing protein n=1 Tax=Longitalea arenae TaxID=2812558 RepID=UPI0019682435|nr:choice-of-anchor Q domain-containing protein [Longitalea arenae]
MKYLFVAILLTGVLISCKKETFITSSTASLFTSTDSLHFDTVFTTTGSITRFFRIYNDNNQKLRLSKVSLQGGDASFFNINVDGTKGPEVTDIEMDANDSIYVFVTVKIDPTVAELPFVIQDSILIEYNGNEHWVQLDAWGQNANFMRNRVITGNVTWTNIIPYVLTGDYLLIDKNATLTIEKGCRIYLHANTPIIVDGTLKVMGEQYDSTRVVFKGDRLDDPYRNFPGSWPGIYFNESSKDNSLQYASIQNAYQGIVAAGLSVNSNPKVSLSECIIDNCYDAGILGLRSAIKARNCLISNCGKNILLGYGGTYDFSQCTAASYSNSYILHKDPVLIMTNYLKEGNSINTWSLNASFRNCIFWGENGTAEDEVVTDKQGNTPFNVNFQNCLWKVKNNPAFVNASNIIANQSPLFDSINTQSRIYNFRLRDESPAINSGTNAGVTIDLDGRSRPVGLPDLGCYEKQ